MAIDKSDDVGMVKALEDVDLRREVILEFLVQLSQVDRLDSDVGPVFLELSETCQHKQFPSSPVLHPTMIKCH